ncbi:hypothetical protein N1F89_13630 [Aquibium sp. A9E412]|uniref:hypothetical protein n=1 Tax=Aquibium sp. A9E412 TaxID=2976767 RepID=UPI0025B13154|nr:hypothetical protein [Aquibium sp. A9E412]MDN2567264.1 hypothetical protein [Aquibium sp. A9E412]
MIKFVVAAVWISLATLGAVFYAFQATQARQSADPPPPLFGGLDYMRTRIVSVPVVGEGRVQGYFLVRLAYAVQPGKLAKLALPPDMLMVDELHTYLYGNPQTDWANVETIDIEGFKAGIRDAINARVGDELVHEVLIEQIDFLSKEEIRDNTLRRRLAPPENEEQAAAPAAH